MWIICHFSFVMHCVHYWPEAVKLKLNTKLQVGAKVASYKAEKFKANGQMHFLLFGFLDWWSSILNYCKERVPFSTNPHCDFYHVSVVWVPITPFPWTNSTGWAHFGYLGIPDHRCQLSPIIRTVLQLMVTSFVLHSLPPCHGYWFLLLELLQQQLNSHQNLYHVLILMRVCLLNLRKLSVRVCKSVQVSVSSNLLDIILPRKSLANWQFPESN